MNIKKEFKLAFSENKLAFAIAFFILFSSILLGYIFEHKLYNALNPVVDDLTNKVESGVIQLTFQSIFFNNIQIIFSMFVLGLLFCFSGVILAFNGFFTGYYVATTNDLFVTLLLIIPHGIFEFSSCIVACMSGFVLFNFIIKFIKQLVIQNDYAIKERICISFDGSFHKLKQAFILFFISSILMVIAGIIEVYFTVPFAEFVLSFFS